MPAGTRDAPYSYPEVGALKLLEIPSGYRASHHRVRLGSGGACYERAKDALKRWQMFDLDWIRLSPEMPPILAGTVVAISARFFGAWFTNVGRIAYTVEEKGTVERCGFGLGTLRRHVLAGEERFCVEWNRGDDSVWYEVHSFSRPRGWLGRAAYPLVRLLQARFRRESGARMVRRAS